MKRRRNNASHYKRIFIKSECESLTDLLFISLITVLFSRDKLTTAIVEDSEDFQILSSDSEDLLSLAPSWPTRHCNVVTNTNAHRESEERNVSGTEERSTEGGEDASDLAE